MTVDSPILTSFNSNNLKTKRPAVVEDRPLGEMVMGEWHSFDSVVSMATKYRQKHLINFEI